MTIPLFVCRSKDCRKYRKELKKIIQITEKHCEPVEVKCQGICKGPVVGFAINERWEWFKRMRGAKAHKALLKGLMKNKVVKELKGHHAKSRSGKKK